MSVKKTILVTGLSTALLTAALALLVPALALATPDKGSDCLQCHSAMPPSKANLKGAAPAPAPAPAPAQAPATSNAASAPATQPAAQPTITLPAVGDISNLVGKNVKVTASALNVRAWDSIQARVVDVVQKDMVLAVTYEEFGWLQVSYTGGSGWVYGYYVTLANEQPVVTAPATTPVPAPAPSPAPVTNPAKSNYVGSQTCLGCHNVTKMADTKHFSSFTPLNKVQFSNPLTEITIKDGAATSNPKTTIVDLNKAIGIHMGSNIVVQVPKEAGFTKEFYRVAEVEKQSDGKYKWEAIADNESEDYSSCMKCHAPGLGKAGTPDYTVSCESCHGPGGAHVAASTEMKPWTISIPDTKTCENCHSNTKPSVDAKTGAVTAVNHYGVRNYDLSAHSSSRYFQGGCLTCHKGHSANANGQLLRADNPDDICAKCHADKKYKVSEIMFKNPVDAHGHITADHSFTAVPLSAYTVDKAKNTMTVTDQKVLDAIKAKLPILFGK